MPTVESNVHLTISSLKERLHFEEFISELSAKFINLPAAEVDVWIEKALEKVVELLDVDRSSLWQVKGENYDMVRTHVYASPGLPIQAGPNKLKKSYFSWMSYIIQKGEILCFSSLDEFPPTAKTEREYFARVNVKSNITIPLSTSGSI
jgi:hypothetical protein